MSPARTTAGAPISSIGRGIAVLGCFDERRRALSLSELSEKSLLPMSSTHRVVAELVAGGFLVRGSDRKYRIGTRVWSIGQLAPVSDQLRHRALPTLARLYEETGENITLAVLDRGQALYVDRIGGERSVQTSSRAGGHLPLHTTGVGKVLLAWQSPEAIDKYLSRPLARATPFSIVDPVKLKADLAETKTRGYALTRQESTAGNGSVAVPILRGGRCVAALGIVAHLTHLDVPRLVEVLQQAADSIRHELEVER
jgi:DNA-binding IclR family transcriptional regulator